MDHVTTGIVVAFFIGLFIGLIWGDCCDDDDNDGGNALGLDWGNQ